MNGASDQSIGTRTLRGVFWAYGSYVGGRLLVLVATAILARLLTPAEFGLVALAVIFTEVLFTVRDLGVSQALVIAGKDELEDMAETAFVFSVFLGFLLSAVVVAISPLAGSFFGEPDLTPLLQVLGCTFLLRSLGTTHYAIAQKRMDFRARTAAELADVVVRGVSGVALALAGAGAWSLVGGYVAGVLSMNIVLWLMVPWRPRLRPQRAHLRRLLSFGGTLTAVDVIAALNQNIDYVVVGRVLGTVQLGLYTVAFRLPTLLIRNLASVAALVLFPAFASMERKALNRAFLVALRYTLMLGLPLAGATVVLAESLTLTVFGDQWEDAVTAMQVITLYSLAQASSTPAGVAYKSLGRADILLKLIVPRSILLAGALALFVDDGIVAVAACQAGVSVLFDGFALYLASRLLDVGLRAIWGAVRSALAAAACMTAVLYGIEKALDTPWVTTLVAGVTGAVVYLGVLWLLEPDALRRLRTLAFPAPVAAEPPPPA